MPKKTTPRAMHKDIYIRDVPPVLQAQYKAACALQGRTMKEVALSLLKAYTLAAQDLAARSDPQRAFAKAAKQVLSQGEVK